MFTYARYPSLEFNWLPLSERKTMPTPVVVYTDLDWCAGCYGPAGVYDDALQLTGQRDTVVLSTRYEPRPSVFAHEYRHMQQHYITSLPRLVPRPRLDFGDTYESWEKAIRLFYTSRAEELNALLFERRHAPDEQNEHVYQLVKGAYHGPL